MWAILPYKNIPTEAPMKHKLLSLLTLIVLTLALGPLGASGQERVTHATHESVPSGLTAQAWQQIQQQLRLQLHYCFLCSSSNERRCVQAE